MDGQSGINEDVRRFLDSHQVGRLGTADPQGHPYVVPICYAVGSRSIYSVVDDKPKNIQHAQLKRIKNILSNPNVCLTVDTYSDDWSKLGYMMIRGHAEILTSGPEHREAADLLRRRYVQYRDMNMEGRSIVAIRPVRIVKWGRA